MSTDDIDRMAQLKRDFESYLKGEELASTSDQDHMLQAIARDESLRRRVEQHLVELEAIRLVRRHRRSIIAVADALAEARCLSGETIRQIVDANRTRGSGVSKLHHPTKRNTA